MCNELCEKSKRSSRKEVVDMNFTPYAHQQAGIEWIMNRSACALLWGMG